MIVRLYGRKVLATIVLLSLLSFSFNIKETNTKVVTNMHITIYNK